MQHTAATVAMPLMTYSCCCSWFQQFTAVHPVSSRMVAKSAAVARVEGVDRGRGREAVCPVSPSALVWFHALPATKRPHPFLIRSLHRPFVRRLAPLMIYYCYIYIYIYIYMCVCVCVAAVAGAAGNWQPRAVSSALWATSWSAAFGSLLITVAAGDVKRKMRLWCQTDGSIERR